MKVCLVTATKRRHRQLERLVRFVINQTSDDWTHLIYNNAPESLRLNANLPTDKFILINSPINVTTHKPYTNLGDIYTDAIKYIPEDCDVVNFMDDDDVFFPNHVEEGLKGLIRGGVKAYKPKKSWYKNLRDIHLVENILEPSIFVMKSHILEHGFSSETTAQHLKWLNPLISDNQIYADPDGPPTYICDWGQEIRTFKTSGDPNNPKNFDNYSNHSQDCGDGIITPLSQSWAEHYYRYIN